MVDERVKELTKKQERDNLRSKISSQINEAITNHIPSPSAVRLRDKDDPHDDAYPEGENDAKRQKTFEHGTFVFGELSSSQDYKSEPRPSMLGNQEQFGDFDFWTDFTDYDELPTEKVSQELVNEMSQTIDEAKLRKNPLAKIFYINKQRAPENPKEGFYSNSNIV
nr:hypothetical protein [Tanacetum cinerariifolium]